MTEGVAREPDRRVLIHVLTRKDSEITQSLLCAEGVPSLICASLEDLLAALKEGASAILIAEERMALAGRAALAEALAGQPPWSDLPLLVLTRPGADSSEVENAVRTLGNVTLIERPMRVSALTSAVRAAVRARERQYQIRGHVAERIRTEESLRAADQRKDEFLATLGHELRNPLAPILTSMQLLKLSTFKDRRSLRACAVMERQVNHLVRLVDDLLEVSRITRGVVDVQKQPLDLVSVLRTAVETSRPLLEEAHQTLSVDLPDAMIPVSGDPVRLTQVFANLLNNASKYTEANGRIWLSAANENGLAIVSVRDNGIGIPSSHLTSVFDMFTQVDRSHRRAQGGLGIGLTLVRSLVQLHGGTVEARSGGSETGSEFIVRLPVAAERPQAAQRSRALAEASAAPRPDRGRQSRCRRIAGRAPGRAGCDDFAGVRGPGGPSSHRRVRARRDPGGPRDAGDGRLRGLPPDPRGARSSPYAARGADRMGAGRGSGTIETRGLRSPSGQAVERPETPLAAGASRA